ncbi:hypothetical protein [Prauserella muralis]|uniref:Uncharacterized protein n=1 Tax=Prauserella muralis TaxID=588067 RepID=A0A2V4BEL3_9PSEU|nr:hypothetical protein [Prauserella muralis]PXY28059.1 hypothetical protein BAY60_17105 [Prauserella muralis]TWE22145.1 hypothetical protein FHX69_3379 [Prauserella muralis]
MTMAGVWALDAVRAEVDYRTEELHRAGRATRLVRRRRAIRRRAERITLPAQRSGAHDAEVQQPLRRAS